MKERASVEHGTTFCIRYVTNRSRNLDKFRRNKCVIYTQEYVPTEMKKLKLIILMYVCSGRNGE